VRPSGTQQKLTRLFDTELYLKTNKKKFCKSINQFISIFF